MDELKDWMIAESKQVSRPPTESEKEARRKELVRVNAVDALRSKVLGMDDGEERVRLSAALEKMLADIETIASKPVNEWVSEMRKPTKAEIAQRKKDLAEAREAEEAAQQERARRKANANAKLQALGLTRNDLKDLLAEVNDGGE